MNLDYSVIKKFCIAILAYRGKSFGVVLLMQVPLL